MRHHLSRVDTLGLRSTAAAHRVKVFFIDDLPSCCVNRVDRIVDEFRLVSQAWDGGADLHHASVDGPIGEIICGPAKALVLVILLLIRVTPDRPQGVGGCLSRGNHFGRWRNLSDADGCKFGLGSLRILLFLEGLLR